MLQESKCFILTLLITEAFAAGNVVVKILSSISVIFAQNGFGEDGVDFDHGARA